MLSKEDEQLWKEYTKGVVPLKKEGRITKVRVVRKNS